MKKISIFEGFTKEELKIFNDSVIDSEDCFLNSKNIKNKRRISKSKELSTFYKQGFLSRRKIEKQKQAKYLNA